MRARTHDKGPRFFGVINFGVQGFSSLSHLTLIGLPQSGNVITDLYYAHTAHYLSQAKMVVGVGTTSVNTVNNIVPRDVALASCVRVCRLHCAFASACAMLRARVGSSIDSRTLDLLVARLPFARGIFARGIFLLRVCRLALFLAMVRLRARVRCCARVCLIKVLGAMFSLRVCELRAHVLYMYDTVCPYMGSGDFIYLIACLRVKTCLFSLFSSIPCAPPIPAPPTPSTHW